MIRNLKVLGLVLMAAFAICAVGASIASAVEFKSESNLTTLTGSQEGTDVLTMMGGTADCTTITYEGAMVGTSAAELEVIPTYSGCTVFGFINIPIDVNGCKYKFTSGEEVEGNLEGSVHIICPEGKAIEITSPGCTVTIGAQTPTGGTVTYTNIGSGTTREITIDVSLEGIHYIEDKAGKTSTCSNPGETTTDGKYTGHIEVTGENGSEVHKGIWLPVPPPPAGEFTSPESSGTTVLTGSQEGSDVFTTDLGTVTCSNITYKSVMTGTETEEAEVTPTYSGCTAFGFINVPIDVNGCKYLFTANQSMHILCPAGQSIQITSPGCTVTIGEQTPTGPSTIEYTNIGSSTTQEITIDASLKGIHYIEDKPAKGTSICKNPGETTTDGTYSGHAKVSGETTGGIHTEIKWDA